MTVQFVSRRMNSGLDFRCIDLSKSTKRAVASLLMDRAAIDASCQRTRAQSAPLRDYCAVYVIAPDTDQPVSKIGIACDPVKRLCGVQTSLWCDAHIRSLIWTTRHIAGEIEGAALRLAKSEGLALRGEWVDLPADEAAGLILTSLDPTRAWTDPRTFADQWIPQITSGFVADSNFAAELMKQTMNEALLGGRELTPQDRRQWFMQTK